MKTGFLLRDVLLACLLAGTAMMILLANSIDHKMSSPPTGPAGALKTLIKARSAAEAAGARLGKTIARAVGRGGAVPAPGPWPRPFVIAVTASPSAQPETEVLFNLRNCECVVDGVKYTGAVKGMPALGRAPAACTCKEGVCPKHTNIGFFTDAEGQDVCSLRRFTGYGCTAGCFGEDKPVAWYGHSCNVPGAADQKANLGTCEDLVVSPPPSPSASATLAAPIVPPRVTWDPATRADLRGLQCELRDGAEVCFSEDSQGRTECPDYVTSEYLRHPPKEVSEGKRSVSGRAKRAPEASAASALEVARGI
jgi:hypothetical protein